MAECDIHEFAKTQLTLPDKIDPADEMSWQHYLYSQLGQKKEGEAVVTKVDELVDRIVAMAKVLYGLHMVSIFNHSIFLISLTRSHFVTFIHTPAPAIFLSFFSGSKVFVNFSKIKKIFVYL